MSKAMNTLTEAMTASEIADAQQEHYVLDDHIRRMTGRLTAEQKRKVIDTMTAMCGPS